MIRLNDIDTLILGCTHYPLLLSVLSRELGGHRAGEVVSGSGISLVNPAYETAIALKDMLESKSLLSDRTDPVAPAEHSYYVSDDTATFRRFAEDVLGIRAENVYLKVLE